MPNAFIKGNVEDPFHVYGEFVLGEYESRISGSSPLPIVHLHWEFVILDSLFSVTPKEKFVLPWSLAVGVE